jgi:hypothetical protein
MNARLMPLLAVVALAGTLAGARALLWPLVPSGLPDVGVSAAAPAIPTHAAGPAPDSLSSVILARDPFRLTRSPAAIAYDPLHLAEQLAPPSPKPTLVLVGLVAGAEPTAVVQGFPGIDGPRVVRLGDQVSGIRVRAISRDEVRLSGTDTTWVLRLRLP